MVVVVVVDTENRLVSTDGSKREKNGVLPLMTRGNWELTKTGDLKPGDL